LVGMSVRGWFSENKVEERIFKDISCLADSGTLLYQAAMLIME